MQGEIPKEIGRLVASVENLGRSIDLVRGDVHKLADSHNDVTTELTTKLAVVERSQNSLSDSYAVLARIVRDGNGQPSLLERVLTVETRHEVVSDEVSDLKKLLNTVTVSRAMSRGQIIAGIAGMVITALMSLGAILAQLFRPS